MYRLFKAVKKTNKLVVAVFIFLALLSLYRAGKLINSGNWKHIVGTEYSWIAKNLSNGHGYSFNTNTRWLFYNFRDKKPNEDYYPTAWEEPIYTIFLAASFKIFGQYGNLVVILFQILALYVTSIMIFMIIRKIFDSHLGILASIGLLLFWPDARSLSEGIFSPSIIAGLLFSILIYYLLWYLDNISVKHSIYLGIALGITCLTLAAFILIFPLTLIIILASSKSKILAWKPTLIVATAFLLTILPWTLRNMIVFGEFVPFRNGVGQGIHMSNNMVAATCFPGDFAHEDSLGPIWKVDAVKFALWEISAERDKRMAIYRRAYDCIALEAPKNYSEFNEAQRDKFYLKSGLNFIYHNPSIFINLTFNKLKMFLIGWDRKHKFLSILMILGIVFSFKNRNRLVITLAIISYLVPFMFIGAWFYRYRYPIEPMIIVIASTIPIIVFNWVRDKYFPNFRLFSES